MKTIIEHVRRAFALTADLVQSLPEENLQLKMGTLPSNSIGQQIWCMTGARESFLKAMVAGTWSGFGCSLQDPHGKDGILRCLQKSNDEFLEFVHGRELSGTQLEFLLSLLEHEVQHHGQLIRFVYANRLGFPNSWKARYTV